jgi:hypothetical protein
LERSEGNFQSVLDLARTFIALSLAESIVSVGCEVPGNCIERPSETGTIGIADVTGNAGGTILRQIAINTREIRRVSTELHLIEEVEELHSKLHCDFLFYLEILIEREVSVGNPWSGTVAD